jgi:predicted acetyltransferase
VAHCIASIGAPREWLEGYLGGLIAKQELFGAWQDGELIATGESRLSHEHQPGYADLGVIVAPSQRGRGLATQMLRELVDRNDARGLRSICSTQKGNTAAQTAIRRAGFRARNRIVQFDA